MFPLSANSLSFSSPDDTETDIDDSHNSVLDVTHPDSPYGLIQDVLPSKKTKPKRKDVSLNDVDQLDPDDIWLSDGNLLVLKGGTTSSEDGFDDPWPPLDDYQAPYRYLCSFDRFADRKF